MTHRFAKLRPAMNLFLLAGTSALAVIVSQTAARAQDAAVTEVSPVAEQGVTTLAKPVLPAEVPAEAAVAATAQKAAAIANEPGVSGKPLDYAAQSEMTVDNVKAQATRDVMLLLQVEEGEKTNSDFFKALVATYEHNPGLRAARQSVRATFEELTQADSNWRPNVGASANVTHTKQDTDPGTDQSNTAKAGAVTLQQALYRGGRTMAQVQEAKDLIRSSIANLESIEQNVLLQAVMAYMNVIRDEALVELSANNSRVIGEQFNATRERFDVGELTRTDVSQAEARLARAGADIIAARGNLQSSIANFERVIGYNPADLRFPLPLIPVPVSLDEAIKYADGWNPDVRSSQYLHKSSESTVSVIRGELLPDISIQGSLGKSKDPSPTINDADSAVIGVVATIPLYEASSVRSRVRQAKYVTNQRYTEVLDTKRSVREMVISSWENLAAARAEIEARTTQLEAAEVARYGVKQEADLGARTILDTLDADQEVLDAQTALVTAKRNEVVARFELAAAMGVLNPTTMGFAEKIPDYDSEVESVRRNLLGLDVDRVSP